MGMAASQARFLGLTARKSNVEYQVQQINQQRTSLANESAGLYNQMLELSVPTPPSVNSFTKTVYVLEDTSGINTENYTIANMVKTYNNAGEYLVTLETKQLENLARDYIYEFRGFDKDDQTGDTTIKLNKKNESKTFSLTLPSSENLKTGFNEKGEVIDIAKDEIYLLPEDEALRSKISGYDQCQKYAASSNTSVDDTPKYYYKSSDDNKTYFLSEAQLALLTSAETENGQNLGILSTYEHKKSVALDVKGTLEESSNGRLTSLTVADDEAYPEDLRNTTFALSATSVTDEAAYTQAYNDYEYEKGLYEKAMSDINAQTEAIQSKDQSLELKINQLDTEQNAIQTEMDSVTKIIEDNIDKTFNIFG